MSTADERRHNWAQKITSHEQWLPHFNEAMNNVAIDWDLSDIIPLGASSSRAALGDLETAGYTQAWWVWREAFREQCGVYPEPTGVLKALRHVSLGFGVYWPHISKDDPTMVAYTPDQQAGINDRQVKTSLGKLLRRWFPTAPDHVIQRIEASHRADMDPTFLVARTAEEIEQVYNEMRGDSGCMRYGRSHFDLTSAHPSHVYAAPNMGVAYHKAGEDVVSRAVIWDNPADPADKRYVRIYGDSVLKRKLERAGYRCAGLAGARLKIVRDESWDDEAEAATDTRIVMPYVDPAGGIHSGIDGTLNSQYGVRMAGEDTVLLLTNEEAGTYQNAGVTVFPLRGQAGYVHATITSQEVFSFTDVLTGLQHSRLTTLVIRYCTPDGRLGETVADGLPPEERVQVMQAWSHDQDRQSGAASYFCSRDTMAKFSAGKDLHGVGWGVYDNDESLSHVGLCRLPAELYADTGLVARSTTRMVHRDAVAFMEAHKKTGLFTDTGMPPLEQIRVLRSDSVRVNMEGGMHFLAHMTEVPALKKLGWLPVGVYNNVRQLAHKTNPKLATTVSGRRVLINLHDVVMLPDGRYEFERNVQRIQGFGMTWFAPRDLKSWSSMELPASWLNQNLNALDDGRSARQRHAYLLQALTRGLSAWAVGSFVDPASDEIVSITSYMTPKTSASVIEAARRQLAAHDADPVAWMRDTGFAEATLFWAKTVLSIAAEFEAGVQRIYEHAERHAREWPVAQSMEGAVPTPTTEDGELVKLAEDVMAQLAQDEPVLTANAWIPETVVEVPGGSWPSTNVRAARSYMPMPTNE